jgi:hypothetical protein
LDILVDHRNDQWISENRLSGNAGNEQTEITNEQLNDSTNSLSGRKRARLKRRLNDVYTDYFNTYVFILLVFLGINRFLS